MPSQVFCASKGPRGLIPTGPWVSLSIQFHAPADVVLMCMCQSCMSAQLALFWRVRWGLVLNMHQGLMDLSPWQPSQESCGADREAVRLTQPSALHIIICFFQSPADSYWLCHWGLSLWPPCTSNLIYAVRLVKLYKIIPLHLTFPPFLPGSVVFLNNLQQMW